MKTCPLPVEAVKTQTPRPSRARLRAALAPAFAALFCLACLAAQADTLFFVPTIDPQTSMLTELWSSQINWYTELSPVKIQALNLPQPGDTVYIDLSEYRCVVDVPSVSLNTLYASANIVGGDFVVQTVNSQNATFDGATLEVQNQWNSVNDALMNATVIIDSGALLFLNDATLYANNSILDDIGQIELMDGATLLFSSGTNQLKIAPNAELTGIGANLFQNAPGNPLLLDNNGVIQSQDGTLTFETDNIFWTNSEGSGYFATAGSNDVIKIFGPFAVQANCTNFISGPGVFQFYNGIETTIDGLLQVGLADPSPGTVDYHAYTMDGTGAVNVSGSAGAPSAFIWESGTLAGPPINIDAQSLLIISNALGKGMSNSVVNNAGTAAWVGDGVTLSLDYGAVFNNLGSFTAENSATLQGGAGSSPSFFNNSGAFQKAVSSGSTSFLQDDEPAPSFYFVNTGLLDVQTGILYLEWGTNAGRYNVAQGAQLHFWNGTNAQAAGASYTGAGDFAIDSGDFWLAGNQAIDHLQMELNGRIDGPGDLTVSGLLTLSSGTVQGAGGLIIPSSGSLVGVSNNFTLARNVSNAGTAILDNVALFAAQPLTWSNLSGSSMELTGAAGLGNTIGYSGPPPVLNNGGTLFNEGSNLYTATINWTTTNSGDITANGYAFDFNQSLIQTAGITEATAGATLSVSSEFGHVFDIEGGTLEGQGTVSAFLSNAGTIHPGASPGILTLGFGTLTNLPGSVLAVDIAGLAPGAQYSQVNSGNARAQLNNLALDVTFGNGFAPAPGESFVIWTNAQVSGAFSTLAGASAGGVVLVPQYQAGTVSLVAANNPTLLSPALAAGIFSFGLQTTAGLTNLVQFTPTLSPPNWQPLTNVIGDGRVQFVTDAPPTNTTRFYRVTFVE